MPTGRFEYRDESERRAIERAIAFVTAMRTREPFALQTPLQPRRDDGLWVDPPATPARRLTYTICLSYKPSFRHAPGDTIEVSPLIWIKKGSRQVHV